MLLDAVKLSTTGLTHFNQFEGLRHGLQRRPLCRQRELALVAATKELADGVSELRPDGFIVRNNFAKLRRRQFLCRQIIRRSNVVTKVLRNGAQDPASFRLPPDGLQRSPSLNLRRHRDLGSDSPRKPNAGQNSPEETHARNNDQPTFLFPICRWHFLAGRSQGWDIVWP